MSDVVRCAHDGCSRIWDLEEASRKWIKSHMREVHEVQPVYDWQDHVEEVSEET